MRLCKCVASGASDAYLPPSPEAEAAARATGRALHRLGAADVLLSAAELLRGGRGASAEEAKAVRQAVRGLANAALASPLVAASLRSHLLADSRAGGGAAATVAGCATSLDLKTSCHSLRLLCNLGLALVPRREGAAPPWRLVESGRGMACDGGVGMDDVVFPMLDTTGAPAVGPEGGSWHGLATAAWGESHAAEGAGEVGGVGAGQGTVVAAAGGGSEAEDEAAASTTGATGDDDEAATAGAAAGAGAGAAAGTATTGAEAGGGARGAVAAALAALRRRGAGCDVDFVFLHGIDGSGLRTWRCAPKPLPSLEAGGEARSRLRRSLASLHDGTPQHLATIKTAGSSRRALWPAAWLGPELLARFGVGTRMISVAYDARPQAGLTTRPDLQLESTGRVVGRALRRAGVGADGRPVVFVCHSMGGLVLKTALLQAAGWEPFEDGGEGSDGAGVAAPDTAGADPAAQAAPGREGGLPPAQAPQNGTVAPAGRVAGGTDGRAWLSGPVSMVFLATPHRGSQVAEFADALESIPGLVKTAPALRMMRPGHPSLLALNENFIDLVLASRNGGGPAFHVVRVLSVGEGLNYWLPAPMGGIRIVAQESADPGIGAFVVDAASDHMTVNKPSSPGSRLMAQVVHSALAALQR